MPKHKALTDVGYSLLASLFALFAYCLLLLTANKQQASSKVESRKLKEEGRRKKAVATLRSNPPMPKRDRSAPIRLFR